jgi:P27 family predicted phage terminase small subunit
LESLGRLRTVDRALLLVYVRTWAQWDAASRRAVDEGPIVTHPNGTTSLSQAFRAAKLLEPQVERLLARLGLTPPRRKAIAEGRADDGTAGELDF